MKILSKLQTTCIKSYSLIPVPKCDPESSKDITQII